MTTDQPDGETVLGPTVLRMLLGAQLRRLREAAGVSRADAGWEIRASESKISRMELGQVSFKVRDVEDLLARYGLDDAGQREAMLARSRQANTPGWWHGYRDVFPNWFQSYLDLEAAAARIRAYEVQFVPGLLQTEEYARAVIRLGLGMSDTMELERLVALRMARRRVFTRRDPPQLWAVVDEAVLRRPIGGRDALRTQLLSLMDATRLPNVRIQVIPFRTGGHPAAGGAFTILRFDEYDLPDVVYAEQLTSALYLDDRGDVDTYVAAMERLCIEAEPPARTGEFLDRALHELYAPPA